MPRLPDTYDMREGIIESRHNAKFCRNRSNRGRDMAILRFFQDDGRRHLGFSNFETFNGPTAQEG